MKVWKNLLGNTYIYTDFGICLLEFYFLQRLLKFSNLWSGSTKGCIIIFYRLRITA